MSTTERPRILVVGGGYVGLYAARRILKKMRYGEATVTVVDPRSYMTYQPFLPEAAAGSISPRHVVVPLRRVLPGGRGSHRPSHHHRPGPQGRHGRPARRRGVRAALRLPGHRARRGLPHLPDPRALPSSGIGMKGVEEAIGLRNHVLEQLDKADSTNDEEIRRKALTFVFVGGGFAGAETIGEVEDMARDAAKYYKNVKREDMRFVLVDAADKILPEVGPELGAYGKEAPGVPRYRGLPQDRHGLLRRRSRGAQQRPRGRLQHHRVDRRRQAEPGAGPLRPAARPPWPRGHPGDPPGAGHRLHLGRGRQRPGPGPRRPRGRQRERLVPAERPARAAPGQGPRRQRDLRHAGLPAEGPTATPTRARSPVSACTRASR